MYYSPTEATREIKSRLSKGAEIVFIPHAEEQMCKRNINGQEVTSAVRGGNVRTPGELINDEYRYRIESNLYDGIAVVVEIPEDNPNLIVITTFPLNKKKLKKK